MATRWIRSVRETGELTISLNSRLHNTVWQTVIRRSVRGFNRLSQQNQIGVQLRIVNATDSNIVVDILDGSASIDVDQGITHSISLSGNALQGHTTNLSRTSGLFKSYMFLPSNPQINTPDGQRAVGNGVKLVIAVHEFIHCCGLSNDEHSIDDIFTANPSVDYGRRPNQDVVEIQAHGRRRRAPPLFLESTTVSALRSLWPHRQSTNGDNKQSAVFNQNKTFAGLSHKVGEVHGSCRTQGPWGIGFDTV